MDTLINEILGPAGALVLCLTALIGSWRKWWVPGWLYKEMERDRDEWKRLALRGTRLAERVAAVAEKGSDETL